MSHLTGPLVIFPRVLGPHDRRKHGRLKIKPQNECGVVPGKQTHAVEEENIVQAPLPLASWFSLKTSRKLFAVGKAYSILKSMRKQCRDHKNAVKSCLEIVKRHKFSLCRLIHEISHCEKSGKLMD